ncbi:chromate transporter [Faecalibacterium prausnitzii]|uniref:chromate transporter n=1 Tax=Faecalibacterium prausnitzii TaxID=853 RepID=UPI001FAA3F79|nr:chromate transporter [Faecalibacterium prausnitzii]
MDENKTYGTRLARLWKLFLSTLYISSFTFGGGFVIVTFMKKKFVDELHWIDEQEMLDMTALAQSSPGAIAVNAAILVGWQVEGLIGMIVAVLGTIIPPMVILSVISVFYNAFATNRYIALLLKGMQAGVAAVILDVVFDLGGKVLKTRSWVYIVLMVAAFVAKWSCRMPFRPSCRWNCSMMFRKKSPKTRKPLPVERQRTIICSPPSCSAATVGR